ncbi:sigma-70 family RNA polymerase sigma factor [Amycolatopsis sp. H6(2020)]|nr:sigma-70 family RNA polymerase sigma factor [Amycolatopsis sp. H6(2020)]
MQHGRERDEGISRRADDSAAPTTPGDDRESAEKEADEDTAAEALERRRDDQKLLEHLVAENFTGLRWHRFATEMVRYGVSVMIAKMRTGEIFVLCRQKRRGIGNSAPEKWTHQDHVDLANETVTRALRKFKANALAGKGWTIDGGANLATYFVGGCFLEFPNVYRAWKKEYNERAFYPDPTSQEELETPTIQSPEDAWLLRSSIDEGIERLPDDRTRIAVVASDLGFTHEEITDLIEAKLGVKISVGTVKQILYRHRKRRGGAES